MVLLPWTPPYDWAWMVGFLQARAVAGVERFHDGGYSRSFGVEDHRGLIHLAPDEEAQGLRVTLSPGLQPVAEICYARIGQLFDLACDPRQVARTLGDLAQARPGSFSRRSIPQNSLRDTGSTPVVGSSRKRTSGLWIRAQLRASFCFMPPDNAPARRLRKGSICR